MRKRSIIIFILALIMTNLTTYKLTSYSFKEKNNYLLKMKGEGENWIVSDYQIAYISSNKFGESGNAKLFYKGNLKEVKIDSIKVELYDYFQEGNQPHHISIPNFNKDEECFKMGGGTFYLPENIELQHIANDTYILIMWKTKDGNRYEERIQLKLDYDLPSIKNFYK